MDCIACFSKFGWTYLIWGTYMVLWRQVWTLHNNVVLVVAGLDWGTCIVLMAAGLDWGTCVVLKVEGWSAVPVLSSWRQVWTEAPFCSHGSRSGGTCIVLMATGLDWSTCIVLMLATLDVHVLFSWWQVKTYYLSTSRSGRSGPRCTYRTERARFIENIWPSAKVRARDCDDGSAAYNEPSRRIISIVGSLPRCSPPWLRCSS